MDEHITLSVDNGVMVYHTTERNRRSLTLFLVIKSYVYKAMLKIDMTYKRIYSVVIDTLLLVI